MDQKKQIEFCWLMGCNVKGKPGSIPYSGIHSSIVLHCFTSSFVVNIFNSLLQDCGSDLKVR
jgi:hypothetical protein